MIKRGCYIALLAVGLTNTGTHAAMQWGRPDEQLGAVTLSLSAGSVFGVDGEVHETTRPIHVLGIAPDTPPEDYSWDELGFDSSAVAFGFAVDKFWKYITLHMGVRYTKLTGEGVADRNYYIGVDKIESGGKKYEYMTIPEGTPYSGDVHSFIFDSRVMYTPFTIGSISSVTVTPWVHLGLFAFIGDYKINAGPERGVIPYQNPPHDYVIGGSGSGTISMVMPEIGAGLEIRIALNERTKLLLSGHAAFLDFSGNTSTFGISTQGHDKRISVDYKQFGGKIHLERALNPQVDLILGVEYINWSGDGSAKAKDRPYDEAAAIREKFDKNVSFEASSLMGVVGIRF